MIYCWTTASKHYNHTVIARLSTGEWSAPSAIATIGCQYGFLAGADLTDYIVVLATDDAVRAFAGLGQFTVGGEIDVSPILRMFDKLHAC